MRTFAVLPVKRFDAAKQRLGAGLEPAQRRALAEAMVGDVLAALGAVPAIERVVVVSGEPRARELAAERGMTVRDDPVDSGQSAAAGLGIALATAKGAERVLLVPGDCPALDPVEVARLLEVPRGTGPHVTIVPDRHGTGTNALLLAPPLAIAPAFGPGSRERHARLAAAAGVPATIASLASLALDVDTPDDLAALRDALGREGAGAPRTRAALDAILAGTAPR